MRLHRIAYIVSSGLMFGSTAFAVNPVQGVYFGLLGEMSIGPASYSTVITPSVIAPNTPLAQIRPLSVRVNNSRIGGGGGAMLGLRYNNMRFEGELLYNWVGSGTMDINGCTLESPDVLTPTGDCTTFALSVFEKYKLGYNGSIATTYGMVNAFYDFIDYETERNLFPYVGLGAGYTQVKASGAITLTGLDISRGTSVTANAFATQGIVGIGLFIDDYTWLGMDYRYLSTNSLTGLGDRRYAISTLNFTATGSFDRSGS